MACNLIPLKADTTKALLAERAVVAAIRLVTGKNVLASIVAVGRNMLTTMWGWSGDV